MMEYFFKTFVFLAHEKFQFCFLLFLELILYYSEKGYGSEVHVVYLQLELPGRAMDILLLRVGVNKNPKLLFGRKGFHEQTGPIYFHL